VRVAVTIAVTVAISGCGSLERSGPVRRVAEVAVATEPQCDKPGVRLDSIKRAGSLESRPLTDHFASISLPPGRYEIAVACQNPLNEAKAACTYWGHPNEYPTYKMPLKAGVRYTFHCYESGSDLSYRIAESDL